MSRRVKTRGGALRGKERAGNAGSGSDDNPSAAVARFFEGLGEMRSYLDRHIQDPERRRARLARIAQQLLRPRDPQQLGSWIVAQLREAVGARGCTLLLRRPAWHVWLADGESSEAPPKSLLEMAYEQSSPREPIGDGDKLLIAVDGVEDLFGALWLEACPVLDSTSRALLQALSDTAGVALDQGLKADLLTRDPVSGLQAEPAFLEAARRALEVPAKKGAAHVLVALRVAGAQAVREAYGRGTAQHALVHLARAVEVALPDALAVGARFDSIIALLPPHANDVLEDELAMTARRIADELRRRSAKTGPPLSSSTSYFVLARKGADLATALERLALDAREAQAGVAVRVN